MNMISPKVGKMILFDDLKSTETKSIKCNFFNFLIRLDSNIPSLKNLWMDKVYKPFWSYPFQPTTEDD